MSAEEALAPTSRHQYKLPDGRVAYEWSQSLDDVTVFVLVPPGVRGKDLDVRIENRRCTLGIRGNPPYLDVSMFFVSFAFVMVHTHAQRMRQRARARCRERTKRRAIEMGKWRRSDADDDKQQKKSHVLFFPFLFFLQHETYSVVKASESFWTLGKY